MTSSEAHQLIIKQPALRMGVATAQLLSNQRREAVHGMFTEFFLINIVKSIIRLK